MLTRVRQSAGGIRWALLALVVMLALVGLMTAVVAPGAAAPKSSPGDLTLVFAGQVEGDSGLTELVEWPPVEGGQAQVYLVPSGQRLVIESLYADVYERWMTDGSTPRSGVTVGISTAYQLAEPCQFPGYQRSYGIPLTDPVIGAFDGENEARRVGDLSGPIFVEGGRQVNGTAFAPNGDSLMFVSIVVHGRLEAASNPPAPVFDCQ